MSRQYTGRIGIGDGWYLVFDRPFVDDPVVGDDVLTFSNADLLVLPTVVPIPDHVTDAWVADWNAGAAARAVADGGADADLGPIQGQGWTGSLAAQSLPEGGETALRAYLGAPRATLHLTVRYRDPANEAAARALIAAVQHDAAGAAEMNRLIHRAAEGDGPGGR
ncbi:MAG TPA: hypothetical protein VFM01_10840 [Nakamurella sp.]|jgi:hypothetical protein|nr:hypothetical protein [Nakamurella sp.]